VNISFYEYPEKIILYGFLLVRESGLSEVIQNTMKKSGKYGKFGENDGKF